MKIVNYKKYGTPEVIQIIDARKPEPKENEVLIKVMTSSLSPAECAFRKADPFIVRFFGGLTKPKGVPGDMLSGVIEDVGSSVTKFKVGDRVFGSTGPAMGAHGEFLILKDSDALAILPEELAFYEGSSIADGAITALPFIKDHARLSEGQHILINGASGSIGTYAIQLAKYYGATVTAVCSGKNHDLVKSLGADITIDYHKTDFTTHENAYDVIFDTVGKSSFGKCKNALTKEGKYLTTVPDFGAMIRGMFLKNKQTKKPIFAATGMRKPEDKLPDFEFMAVLAKEGKLKTVKDRVYNFETIKEGHAYVDTGHKVGNVVLEINK